MGDRAGQKFQGDTPLRRPVRRRIVEGDRNAPAGPARHDARGSIFGWSAPRKDANERADADLRAPDLASGGGRIGDEGPSGKPALLDRIRLGYGHSTGGALSQGQPRRGVLESLAIRGPFRLEQGDEALEMPF